MSQAPRRTIRPGCKALSIMSAPTTMWRAALIVELTETAALHHFEENARFVSQLQRAGRARGDRRFRRRLYLVPQSADAACRYGQDRRLLCEGSGRNRRRTRSSCARWSAWPRILGIKTVAEWVGSDADAALLQSFGVDYFQGFHFGEPLLEPEWSETLSAALAPRRRAGFLSQTLTLVLPSGIHGHGVIARPAVSKSTSQRSLSFCALTRRGAPQG